MVSITVTAKTSANPDQVLAIAGTDFSAHRAKVWLNVTEKRLQVHERGDTFADVTEGGTGIARFFWERCHYDWSHPRTVKATVVDSNVLEPGSTWELRVASRAHGSRVEMTLDRRFRRSLAGRTALILNRINGKRGFGWMLRSALKEVERASVPSARADPRQAAA